MKTKIESWGLTDAIADKFTSCFIIGNTTIYEISEQNSGHQYANLTLPVGIKVPDYHLELSSISTDKITEKLYYTPKED